MYFSNSNVIQNIKTTMNGAYVVPTSQVRTDPMLVFFVTGS